MEAQSLSEFIGELERSRRAGKPFHRIVITPLPTTETLQVRYTAFAHGPNDAILDTREFLETVTMADFHRTSSLDDAERSRLLSTYTLSQARTLYFRNFSTELG